MAENRAAENFFPSNFSLNLGVFCHSNELLQNFFFKKGLTPWFRMWYHSAIKSERSNRE